MAHFTDLSKRSRGSKALNVGWLEEGHAFKTGSPARWLVQKLWTFCKCSLLHAGGFHECSLSCFPGPIKKIKSIHYQCTRRNKFQSEEELRKHLKKQRASPQVVEKFIWLFNAQKRKYIHVVLGIPPNKVGCALPLGNAEIIVFGQRGKIYVAPNMIYHYVTAHHYKPPDEFVQALRDGPCPPEHEYIERLKSSLPEFYVEGLESVWRGTD